MATRATWSGSITFGMVNVPAKIYLAADEKAVRFVQLHDGCGARVRHPKRCEKGHDIATMDEIVKGYEVTKEEYLALSDDDFGSLPLASKQAVTIVRFIPRGTVPEAQYLKSYHVAPDGVGERGYALLAKAMETAKVCGLAKLAFRETREHPALVRAEGGRLMLHTLFWPDEIRAWPVDVPTVKLEKDEIAMAKLLVENLSGPYEPEMLTDEYRVGLEKMIDAKLNGKALPTAKQAKTTGAADLMESLKASITAQKKKAS